MPPFFHACFIFMLVALALYAGWVFVDIRRDAKKLRPLAKPPVIVSPEERFRAFFRDCDEMENL